MQALYPSVDHCDCTLFCHHGLTHKFTTEQAKRALHQSQCQISSLELVNESSLSAKATREIQFEDSRRRAAAAEEEAVAQRASAERLAAECEAFKTLLDHIRKKLDEVEVREAKASAGWSAASAQCEVLQVDKAQLEAAKGRMQTEISELRAQVETHLWEAKARETAHVDAKRSWEDSERALRQQMERLQHQLSEGRIREEAAIDTQAKTEFHLSTALQQLEASQAALTACNAETRGMHQKLQQVEEENLRWQRRVSVLEKEHNEFARHRDSALASLQVMVRQILDVEDALEKERASVAAQFDAATERHQALQKKYEGATDEILAIKFKLKVVMDEKDSLEAKHADQEQGRLVEMATELASLKEQNAELTLRLEDAQEKAEEEVDRWKAKLMRSDDRIRELEETYLSAQELLERTSHDHEAHERRWQQQQAEQREMLVKRSQTFMKRWTVRSHFQLWREAVNEILGAKQQDAMAALEAAALKAEERARFLEAKYADTEAELMRSAQEHQAAVQAWDAQQDEYFEMIVKRSQIFMKRWSMRSHLKTWRETTAESRQSRANQDMSAMIAEKDGLSKRSEEEKKRLQEESGNLTQDLRNARATLERLASNELDLKSKLAQAQKEAATESEKAAALSRARDAVSARVTEISGLLDVSQDEGRRLQAEVNRMEKALSEHEIRAREAEGVSMGLKAEKATMSAQLAAKTAECSKQTVVITEMRTELAVLQERNKELEVKLDMARDDGEEREILIAEMQTQTLPRLRDELVERDLSIKDLQGQLAAAKETLQHGVKEATVREESNAQAWSKVKEIRSQLLAREATVQRLQEDLNDSSSTVNRLEKTESEMRTSIQSLKNTVVQLRHAQSAAEEAQAELQAGRDDDEKRLAALREDNASLQKKNTELEDAGQIERQQVRELKRRLSEFDERSKDLESMIQREQAELSRQRAARKETEKHNAELMAKQIETDKAYKARETSAVKALSVQLQKLKDEARQQLEEVSAAGAKKMEEAANQERETRSALSQCQYELRQMQQERKSMLSRSAAAEDEMERLQTDLRALQESEKNLDSDLKVCRRETARLTEQLEASEKLGANWSSKADSLQNRLHQIETELKEKNQELDSAMMATERVQSELVHERRLLQGARTQNENVSKELSAATTMLAEEKRKIRELSNQTMDYERRIGTLTHDLEAKEMQLEGAKEESRELSDCRKELQTVRHRLELAEASAQELLPAKEAVQGELSKLRSAYNELVSKEMEASEQVKHLKRQLESQTKLSAQHCDSMELLDEELKELRERDKTLTDDLSALRRDIQRYRANEAGNELARSREESKLAEVERKNADLNEKLVKAEEKLVGTEASLHDVSLKYEKLKAVEGRVEMLGRRMRVYLGQRVCGERQVRAAVGLPHATTSFTDKSYQQGKGHQGLSAIALSHTDETELQEGMAEELQRFVLQRIMSGWREQSTRVGSGLVHAISVWGWYQTMKAAIKLGDLVEQQMLASVVTQRPTADTSKSPFCSNGLDSQGVLSSAGLSTVLSAKRGLAHAQGLLKDFCAHSPSEACQGSSVGIGAATSVARSLGCAFVDWRSRAIRMRRSRSMAFGAVKVVLEKTREGMNIEFRVFFAWSQATQDQLDKKKHAEMVYPELFEKLWRAQTAYEKSSQQESKLQLELQQIKDIFAQTTRKLDAAEATADALKQELTKFYKLPSPCSVGMELEADMRGQVRVGVLQSRMSAESSGAINEGDIVLCINDVKVSSDNLDAAKAMLVGKRASVVAIKFQRGQQTFVVNLKRGSWGPEHASVSFEQPSATDSRVVAEDQGNQSLSTLDSSAHRTSPVHTLEQVPLSGARQAWQPEEAIPSPHLHGDSTGRVPSTGIVMQGGYAAARRNQGSGSRESVPDLLHGIDLRARPAP